MPMSQEARAIVEAIQMNTRELKKVREAIEKINKIQPTTVNNIFSGGDPEALDLDAPKYD